MRCLIFGRLERSGPDDTADTHRSAFHNFLDDQTFLQGYCRRQPWPRTYPVCQTATYTFVVRVNVHLSYQPGKLSPLATPKRFGHYVSAESPPSKVPSSGQVQSLGMCILFGP